MTWVRPTARQRLALGQPIQALGQPAHQRLAHAQDLQDAPRQRLPRALHAARKTQEPIRTPSGRLTQGTKLRPCQIGKAYEPTMAPIIPGKSHGPAQFGRQPGLRSAPATGCLVAPRVPEGNPRDPSAVWPWRDKGQSALDRVSVPQRLRLPSVAGDLGGNATARRQALHAQGICTVGLPKRVQPMHPTPTPCQLPTIFILEPLEVC